MEVITATPESALNPANLPEKKKSDAVRVPMSLPNQKLSVVEIPGMHCHWMAGNSGRIQQALRGGYSFVTPEEVNLTEVGIGNDAAGDGNTDLGSRVSVVGGADGMRLYLMKIPQELWEQDQMAYGQRQEQIASQIRGDKGFTAPDQDSSQRYRPSRGDNANIFKPNRRA